MDKSIKKKWVDALRSGEYKQGKNALRVPGRDGKEDKFCCLGVLCDVVRPSGWLKSGGSVVGGYTHYGEDGSLPAKVKRLAKFPEEMVFRKKKIDPDSHLAHLNDGAKKGFKYIADWIEKNL